MRSWGVLNGLLVEVAKIDSFIATLGTGTVLYALALWHTGGRQMVGVLPKDFYGLSTTMVFGLPITGYYVIIIAVLMWVIYEYLPLGRYLYAIGASPKAAALNGIPVRKYVIGSFVASGVLTALAGVLPKDFYGLSTTMVFGLPITGYYVIIIAILMWVIYE